MIWDLSDDNKILILQSATELELDQLKMYYERSSPSARFDPRVKRGIWDGKINYFKGYRYLPAGLWLNLVDMCRDYNFEIKINGIERLFNRSVTEDEFNKWVDDNWSESKIKPRDYQIATAFKIIKHKRSLSELATSAGKTLIIYMAMAYLLDTGAKNKILMIVPSVDLVLQSSGDFNEYNEASVKHPIKIQQIYAGAKIKEDSNIVIGTFQSLVKKKNDFFDEFDVVVVDECHRTTAISIKNTLSKVNNADFIFGVTGTIPKKESLDYLTLGAYIGPVYTEIKAKELMDAGYITKCKVLSIEMNYVDNEVRKGFANLFYNSTEDRKKLLGLEQNYVINSDLRAEFVTDFILKNNKNSLVLFHRIDYGKKLYHLLRQKSSDRRIVYIDGGVDKDDRLDRRDLLENEEGTIMIASFGTMSTGISINNIHVIYFTESFKSDVIIRQSIGRGLRLHKDKDELLLVDFVDDYSIGKFKNYLTRHSDKRREIYREQQFPYKVIKTDLDKYKVIKRDKYQKPSLI